MDNAKALARLEDLLEAAVPDGVEEVVEASRDFYACDDYCVMDDVQDEFYDHYTALVSAVSEKHGKPAFNDGMAARGYPEWHESEFLAYWVLGERLAYVAMRHEDKELPYMIIVGARLASRPTI